MPTITCAGEYCLNHIPSHYWGKVKAEGWFHSMNGKSYCPIHVPACVSDWRKNKEK